MAKRGTSKRKSVDQEEWIAALYSGTRSPSSGAADTDQGDVRTARSLIECKVTGEPGKEPRPQLPRFVRWLEKVAVEAWSEGRDPALALRYFDPDSPLARPDGWVDVVVRTAADDSVRDRAYDAWHEQIERDRQAEEDFLAGLKSAGVPLSHAAPGHCEGPQYCEFCGAD